MADAAGAGGHGGGADGATAGVRWGGETPATGVDSGRLVALASMVLTLGLALQLGSTRGRLLR